MATVISSTEARYIKIYIKKQCKSEIRQDALLAFAVQRRCSETADYPSFSITAHTTAIITRNTEFSAVKAARYFLFFSGASAQN